MTPRFLALTLSFAAMSGTLIAATPAATHLTYRASIYSIRDDGTQRVLIAQPEPAVPDLVRSPGGHSILFTRQVDGVWVLFAADRSGANAVRLTPPELPVGEYPTGAFSPDGRLIAFRRPIECGYRCFHAKLYVVGRDGGGLRLIAENAASFSWAPDSRRLAYGDPRGRGRLSRTIYVMDVESTETTPVAQGSLHAPVWAPRGERIAYSANVRGFGVACFVNADGSRRRCTRGRSLTSLVWSRDGRRVAFRQASPRQLGYVDSDARRVRSLGNHGRDARPAAWSPDGKRLLVWSGGGRASVLRLAAPRRSMQVIGEDGWISDIRWRRRSITYVASQPVGP